MKISLKAFALAITAATLTACASVGQEFNMQDVRAFKPGVTTYADAYAVLGPPQSSSFGPDNSRVAVWGHGSSNLFSGAQSKVVVLQFDSEGKFVRIASEGYNTAR